MADVASQTGSSSTTAGKTLRCSIVTPDRMLFEADATKVIVPGHDHGEIGFLPGHAAYLGNLGIGVVRVEAGGKEHRFGVYGGFVQVADNQVTVLANEAEEPGEVTDESLQEDRKRLEELETRTDAGYEESQKLARRVRVREKLKG